MPGPDPAAALDELLADAVRPELEGGPGRVFPGCVARVWRQGELRYAAAVGVLASHRGSPGLGVPVGPETIYDLASLTKVLSTTTLAAQAVAGGVLTLEDRLPEALALRGVEGPAARPSLRDLLEHAAGLEAHREFFHRPWSLGPSRRDELIAAVREVGPACPPRTRAIYTDLGFLLLGAWLERALGDRLDRLFRERIAAPLGVADHIGFRPLDNAAETGPTATLAPTEVYDPAVNDDPAPKHWYGIRERLGQAVAHGVVHDDNCVVMGGVAGHAGLFGTAEGVLAIARAWLERRLPGVPAERAEDIWTRFTTPSTVPGSTRRLGFDGPEPDGGGSTGGAVDPSSVGHLGFTGTSLWIDPKREAIYVLLSNRVHPSRDRSVIRQLRPRFQQLAARL